MEAARDGASKGDAGEDGAGDSGTREGGTRESGTRDAAAGEARAKAPDPASDSAAPERRGALAPLANPTFRTFWLASLASNLGGLIQAVAAAWTMTSLSGSADMVALVQASTTLPIMLFSLASGAVADNFNRRRVMIAAQAGMLVVSVALTLCAWAGMLTPWMLLGFTFAIGCGVALNNPSWQASVGDIVPRSEVPAAVALNSVGFNLTRSIGPAIGGAIVASLGAAAAFAANAVSYVAIIGALLVWRPNLPARSLPPERLGQAMGAGLRYIAMSPHLGAVLLRSFLFGFATVSTPALLPVVARHLVEGGALTYGLLLGAFGIGAIGGAFLGGWLRARVSAEWIVRIAFCAFAVAAATAGLSPSAWLTGAGLMLGGCAWVLALALFNVTVQLSTPRWVVGRTLALYQTAVFGGMALGAWIWGLVAERQGVGEALVIAAACMLASAAVGLVLPLPDRGELDLAPLDRFREPALGLKLLPRSGPVGISVEYRILDADVPEFLAAMADRQRMRQRDGARSWTLMRDLEDPELWVEFYQVATWIDYLRHHQRSTKADAAIVDRLHALHRGPERPHVRRRLVRQTRWLPHAHQHHDHGPGQFDQH